MKRGNPIKDTMLLMSVIAKRGYYVIGTNGRFVPGNFIKLWIFRSLRFTNVEIVGEATDDDVVVQQRLLGHRYRKLARYYRIVIR